MFQQYGSQYGGWRVDLDLIPEGSVILSAGVGEDISFDLAMQKFRKCKIVGIDPTEKSWKFIEEQKDLKDFDLVKKALWKNNTDVLKMYKNKNPEWVSESVFASHNMATGEFHEARTTTISDLLCRYENVSVLKMDIEGSEYDVIESLEELSVPQVCVEFHHFCTEKRLEDTKKCIDKMKSLGYTFWFQYNPAEPLKEITFIHDSAL